MIEIASILAAFEQQMNPLHDKSSSSPPWEEIVRRHVKNLRYGVVQIVVHENRVVQIERTEKVRLEHDRPVPTRHLEANT